MSGHVPYHHRHVLQLYRAAAGESEVPAAYHTWMCLTLLSAAAGDRIRVPKFAGDPLVPNLFTMLIGPSGVGKGRAFKFAAQFCPTITSTYWHAGPITGPGLFTLLARRNRKNEGPPPGKVFLLQEELGMSVGENLIARDFIKHLTGLYDAGSPVMPMTKRTATDGDVVIRDHCVVFAGGTTKPWMIESVPRSAIEGGFFARMACVLGAYNFEKRFPRPIIPPDYDGLMNELHRRFALLSALDATLERSPAFAELEEDWYLHRPVPTDEAEIPTWRRAHDMLLKLAVVLWMGEPITELAPPAPILQGHHFTMARALTQDALRAVPELVDYASQTPESALLEVTRTTIKRYRKVAHSRLLQKLSKRGVNASRLREHIQTLKEEGRIAVTREHGTTYHWRSRTTPEPHEVPPTEAEGDDDDDSE